jgi:hypothetical protein
MIWLLKPINRSQRSSRRLDESTGILPGLPPVAGKPVHVAFDGGRMTSDSGILLLAAIEQRLGIVGRLAACIEDSPGAGTGAAHARRDDPLPSRAQFRQSL